MAEKKEKKAKNIHEVLITIEGDEWKSFLDKAFNKAVKEVKIDGFRKGKVPKSVFEKKYGKQAVIPDATELAVDEAYKRALDEYKGDVIMQPQVAIEKVDNYSITYKFIFTSKPEVKIKKYTDLGVKKDEVKVTKKDVEEEIEKIKKEYADLAVKDGAIENGDTAIIDYEGFDGDKAFEGGKAENYALEIGSNTFIPGFEEALIGLKAGDKKDVNISFPKDYHAEELKGKPVTFKVLVHEVKNKVYPVLDEDFFLDLGLEDVKNVDDFKKTIEDTLKEQREYEAENKYVDDLFEALLKQTTVDVPHELVHEELHRMIHEYEERLKMQGITLEQFYKFTNSNREQLEANMHGEAEKRVTLRFAIEEIIAKEKIEASDEEANKKAEENAKKHGMKTEEYIKAFGGLDMIKYDIKVEKVLDLLKK